MFSDWIIIGAVVVLFVGVVLAFKAATPDTPQNDKRHSKPSAKGAVTNG